jgi:SAM-dependent methyltransferase
MDPLVDFYTGRYDESQRLGRNQLEFVRTQELLRARLPAPPARVLDVGGGTGAHAQWLARDGYAVELVDRVPAHVEAARRAGLNARVGDARSLTGSYDVTLLLGPLYHLPCAADRARALAEAARVTRGLVAAAAISRFAWPLYALRGGVELDAKRLAEVMRTGIGDPVGALPDAYSHTPAGLAAEFADAGLTDVAVLGIEGPAWFAHDDPTVGRLYDAHPEMSGASAHLLGFGRAL